MTVKSPTQVVTGTVRLSFTNLFTPRANNNGGEPKYSTTILLPKQDTATKQRVDMAVEAAKQAGASKCWQGNIPPIVALCIHDGDGVRPSDGMPFGPECKGHWVFTAASKQPPQVVDLQLNPIINQSEVYSGMYARVSVNFFAYNSNGKKGIGCGLNNVQKISDGEPLGGRTNAADDFGQPAQMPAQPQQQYAPAPAQPQQAYAQPQQQYAPAPAQPQQGYAQPNINPLTGLPYDGVMGIN